MLASIKRAGSIFPRISKFYSTDIPTNTSSRAERCLNQVTLMGRCGTDPQLRGADENRQGVIFKLATNSSFRSVGDPQQFEVRTEWHRVGVFKPGLRDAVANYLKKGQRVLVQGRLGYRKYTDPSNGMEQTICTVLADEVIFLQRAAVRGGEEEDIEEPAQERARRDEAA